MKRVRRIRKTEITVETSQVFEFRWRRQGVQVWCPQCAAKVQMITPEEGSAAFGISARTIYRRVEEGRIHFIERGDGLIFICLASLQTVL